jgi:hypothetical protein
VDGKGQLDRRHPGFPATIPVIQMPLRSSAGASVPGIATIIRLMRIPLRTAAVTRVGANLAVSFPSATTTLQC